MTQRHYYNMVEEFMNENTELNINDYYRLFPVAGMNHCRGGDGANSFGNQVRVLLSSSLPYILTRGWVGSWLRDAVSQHLSQCAGRDGRLDRKRQRPVEADRDQIHRRLRAARRELHAADMRVPARSAVYGHREHLEREQLRVRISPGPKALPCITQSRQLEPIHGEL
jgi:hypothetical protein